MKDIEQFFNPEFKELSKLDSVKIVLDYHGRNAYLYDSIQGEFQKDVQFYLKTIGENSLKILELGSGTGRIAIPLAEAGHTVYALDNSDDMHQVLKKKIPKDLKKLVIPVKASMTDFNLDTTFDYIILGLNTIFALVDEEDRINCLKCVRKHLKRKGRFLIDLMLPSSADYRNAEGKYDFSILDKEDGNKCLSITFNKYDIKRQLMILNFLSIEFDKNGEANFFITPAIEYYPFPSEIKLLLNTQGFEIESFCCDYEGTPFFDNPFRNDLIVIAKLK